MHENKKRAAALILLNLAAVACLVFCILPYVRHDTAVANPDAMLPFEAWDGAGWMLTLGIGPMVFANLFGFLYILKKETPIALRLLFFLPLAVQLGFVVHYWCYSLTM